MLKKKWNMSLHDLAVTLVLKSEQEDTNMYTHTHTHTLSLSLSLSLCVCVFVSPLTQIKATSSPEHGIFLVLFVDDNGIILAFPPCVPNESQELDVRLFIVMLEL